MSQYVIYIRRMSQCVGNKHIYTNPNPNLNPNGNPNHNPELLSNPYQNPKPNPDPNIGLPLIPNHNPSYPTVTQIKQLTMAH